MVKSLKKKTACITEMMKSKFIGIAFPVNSIDDFKNELILIKKNNSKAKHIVYAYKIGMNSKSCDDQEPKGTAGRPLLELISKRDLDNVALVVVRYFGGTLLGASRLLRTYVQAANAAINENEIVELR